MKFASPCNPFYRMIISPTRDDSQDETFNIGREFDERYHWHSLRPLNDDYERTRETFTGTHTKQIEKDIKGKHVQERMKGSSLEVK